MMKIANQLLTLTKSSAENNCEKFAGLIPEMIQAMAIIISWAETALGVFSKFTKLQPIELLAYINSVNIVNILMISIQVLIIPAGTQPSSILSCTGHPEFDTSLNEMKTHCIEFGNKLVSYILTNAPSKIMGLPLNAYCINMCPLVIVTLGNICIKEYDKLEERFSSPITSNLITRLLGFLATLLESNNFYPIFNQNKSSIVTDILLVLLRSTRKELDSMVNDPENFVNLAIDACTKQDSETPKTESIKVLEGLCEHIDGCLSFTSVLCCESIKYACNGAKPEDLTKYPMLGQLKNTSAFLLKSTSEIIVETCLLVIADLSYLMQKRKDISSMFEMTMTENSAVLFNSPSLVIRCRLALLIGYYGDSLYKGKDELFVNMIKYLFNGIALEKEQKAFALQCADTVKTIVSDNDIIPRVKVFIKDLGVLLCKMIETAELPKFYEILIRIMEYYYENIEDQLLRILEALVMRVDKEYKQLRAKGERNNMTINQCWNVIRAISEQKHFYPIYLDSIETILLPMFDYIVNPKEIDFDDDIIQIIAALINSRGEISENMKKLFPCLVNFFEKYDKMFGSLFQTLNSYIYYGKTNFIANKECIEYIIKLCFDSLFSTKEVIQLNNTEGAIMLQILLQTLGNGLLDSYIPGILENVLKRLDAPPSADYLSRELYNTILCCICNNPQIALIKIEELKCTEPLFLRIFNESFRYKESYDIKVMVIGLSSIINQLKLPPFLLTCQARILSCIINVLETQTKNETKVLLKADKKIITQNEDSDDSFSDDDDDDDIDESEKGYF